MTLAPLALIGVLAGCPSGEQPKPDPAATGAATAAKTGKPGAIAARTAPTPLRKPAKVPIPPPKDVAGPSADASKTTSGLHSKVLKEGSGEDLPTVSDKVKVHYTGWTKDGKMFDSSVQRGKPAEFQVSGVIKGWTEGLQLMKVGEKRRFWIPADLAYGERPRMGAPAGQLTFDVELLEIKKGPKPPETPDDLDKPPADAKKTKSGLAYKVLKKGDGDKHPTETDRVTVHYSGWTKEGRMFDSSVTRNRPATFPLDNVIKGWTEGVQLMVKGEKTRFWIPADLAYGKKPKRAGAPAGDLVFDIELLSYREVGAGRPGSPGAKKGDGHGAKKGDGHGAKKGDGHDAKKGDGHDHKAGDGHGH
jgi:FKBP-type peptidyl-prolyl cis-trans isomerase